MVVATSIDTGFLDTCDSRRCALLSTVSTARAARIVQLTIANLQWMGRCAQLIMPARRGGRGYKILKRAAKQVSLQNLKHTLK